MSAEGRFLECRHCRLRVQFAAGAHYEEIARQFDSRLRVLSLADLTTSCGEQRSEVRYGLADDLPRHECSAQHIVDLFTIA
jgi:hypothetical protein